MELDRLQLVLRRRRAHEAIDLGLRIHQRWSGAIYAAWFTTVVPVWMVLLATCWALDVLWLGVLLIWWMKPLWGRVPLFVVSRAIFGSTPTPREVWRNLRSIWTTQLLADLTLYRLSPSRSMLMPVGQLEGLTGTRGQARRQVLGSGSEQASAGGLLFAGFTIELLMTTGIIGLLLMMMPDKPGMDAGTIFDAWDTGGGPSWARLAPTLAWLAAVSLVEPVFVSSGFALYLNRRTTLEGWDVELAFRRLAARVASRAQLLGAFLLMVLACAGTDARAADPVPVTDIPALEDGGREVLPIEDMVQVDPQLIEPAPGPSPETTRTVETAAETIFQRNEFGYDREVTHWERKELPTFAGFDLSGLFAWLEGIGEWAIFEWLLAWLEGLDFEEGEQTDDGWMSDGLSSILEGVLWGLVAAMAVGGVIFLVRNRRALSRAPRINAMPAERPLTGGALRRPAEVAPPATTLPEQVWDSWEAGHTDQALTLLYNAALAELITKQHLEVDAAWTEGDCARAVRSHIGGVAADYFQRIVRARTFVSYAHRPPEDRVIRALCDDWNQLAGAA